jgi:hypothetical protein
VRLALACGLILALWLSAASAADPMVQLDDAKLALAAGRIAKARELLGQISTVGAEDYVAEEVLYHQLTLSAAYLSATHYLLREMERQDWAQTSYYQWLKAEREGYLREFARHSEDYLTRTAGGSHLPFVRFRIPLVSDEYLQDTGLYSDAQVLSAAVSNWDDGREGLGRGIIGSQVRIAFVLAIAIHYDLPEASANLEEVAQRLRAGVPINELVVLDWLSATIHQLTTADDGLFSLADTADERIIEATRDHPTHHLYKQAQARRNDGDGNASE